VSGIENPTEAVVAKPRGRPKKPQAIVQHTQQPETMPAATAETADVAMLQMIAAAARDPNVNVDTMERLYELRERSRAADAERAANAAMAQVQAKIVPVVRNRSNDHTRSEYADIAALHTAVMPLVHEGGFGLTFYEVAAKADGYIGIGVTLKHDRGHSERYQFQVPTDAGGMRGNTNKTATQAYGATMTYGRRYATLCVFNVPVATQDTDGNRPRMRVEPPFEPYQPKRRENYTPAPPPPSNDERASHTRQAIEAATTQVRSRLLHGQLEGSLKPISAEQLDELEKLIKAKPDVTDKTITEHFHVDKLGDLNIAQFQTAKNKLKLGK